MSGNRQKSRLRKVLHRPNLILGGVLTGFVFLTGLAALYGTPYPTDGVSIAERLQPPTAAHWLGTDSLGRDLLSMLMKGAQNALLMGCVAVGIGLAVGVPAGLYAAMRKGLSVDAVMRLSDLIFAFPAILTAVLIAALYGPGVTNAILAVGIFNIAVFARVTRGAALHVMGRQFVTAAAAIGRPPVAIAIHHVLPNAAGAIIIQATIQFAVAILAEAGLSYLGLGVQPPDPSWGKMLNDAQTLMFTHPMQAVVPGAAIMIAVLGLNLLGDGLRDVLDPRLRIVRSG